ncbi:MAG: M20 family metallo-hydrolase [Bacteroidaceae bacterium]|nr:M20 family metallo-hydrolase [Bacteroidaceae bacterium]
MTYSPQTHEAVSLLKRLIATPSVSRDEGAAAELIFRFLQDKGARPQRLGNNVWAIGEPFDPTRPTILLNAHIDTVRPVSGWQRDPFTPVLEGDRLYGLGANDCGGGLVSLLETFIASLQLPSMGGEPAVNLVFLASAEEEVSGGSGIESVRDLLPKIDFAIVGEPTGMQPAIAEKGLMVVDAVAHGRAGHAARNEGVNAIDIAVADIQRLKDLEWKTSPLLGSVKTTVTIISAGTQHNVIPDTCQFTIDVRSNELYRNEEIFAILQQNLQSELKARSFRLSSSSIETEHPFVQRCIARGMKPFGSPTLSDQALMPWPSLKLGPGDSARSHTADEYICLSEIDEAIRLYSELLN